MKGVSQIVAAVLILMIGVSVASSAYLFFSDLQQRTINATEEQIKSESKRAGAELKIIGIDVNSGNVTLRNTGRIELKDFMIYVNNQIIEDIAIEKMMPGDVKIINLIETESTDDQIFTVLDQQNEVQDSRISKTVHYPCAQQFTANVTGTLENISTFSWIPTDPADPDIQYANVEFRIYNDNSNSLDSILASQNEDRSAGWFNVSFATPVNIVAGSKYWIWMNTSEFWYYRDDSNVYKNGIALLNDTFMSQWDFTFKTYVTYIIPGETYSLSNKTIKITSDYASVEAFIP